MPRDVVSGLFWLAVAIFALAQGFTLKLGSLQHPGPGFFPFWSGVVLGLLALVLLANAIGKRTSGYWSGPAWSKVLGVAGALLGYLWFLEVLGFVAVTFLFLFLMFRLAQRGWVFSAVSALAGAASSYALFQRWLGVRLPAGPFGF